ncbi:hypothetical protein SDC9_109386 [bioreactor metagenome]|uniref:Uncharacterized protein n=1 Tax=bioreactor metagenome TaxID=1076179 RepID=A0A645BH28_9ZZZZ
MNRKIRRYVFDFGHSSPNLNFYTFCRSFTDAEVVCLAHVFFNVGIEIITGNADTLVADNTTESNNSDFAGTTTDVNDHIS